MADFLSRNDHVAPECSSCKKKIKLSAISAHQRQEDLDKYIEAANTDEIIQSVAKWQVDKPRHKMAFLFRQFHQVGTKWFFGKRLYIPGNEALRLEVLSKYHDTELAGHQGVQRTRKKIIDKYFWPGMEKDIRSFVRTCIICQRHSEKKFTRPPSTSRQYLSVKLRL